MRINRFSLKNRKTANILIFLSVIFSIFAVFLAFKASGHKFGPNFARSQTTSPDAIALRVAPNSDYYSANRWYREQAFGGSPQSLTLDGYPAVRDGRTVYVNAGNVEGGELYTNIYVISYNQEAESATVDIFGNILKSWKFNSNLIDLGRCINTKTVDCLNDRDCPKGEYCTSLKARVARDTIRLADLAEICFAISNYQSKYGHYPKLDAGTYLPYRSLSTWPSWQQALGKAAAFTMPTDPINKLGGCYGYDPVTCWNEHTKTFATELPTLPGYSRIYQYEGSLDGSTYYLCAVMESPYVSGPFICETECDDFDGDGYGNPASSACEFGAFDCDDENFFINPGAEEDCVSPEDDDCDGLVNCADPDCSGHIICTAPCTDFTCNNICGPGCTAAQDRDCDCVSANGCCTSVCPFDPDCGGVCVPTGCDVGAQICNPFCTVADDPSCGCVNDNGCCGIGCDETNDNDCSATYEGASEICDGLDNDGDGLIDEDCDLDGDGYCGCHPPYPLIVVSIACPNTNTSDDWWIANTCDCDDRPDGADGVSGNADDGANIHPGLAETGPLCADGVDNDCDGLVDCSDNTGCTVADCCDTGTGAGVCNSVVGENNTTCPADCPANCGDGICGVGECLACPADCTIADCCGNGTCDGGLSDGSENNGNCSPDCPISCPDGFCDVAGGECDSCSADCGFADCCGPDPDCNAAVGEDCDTCSGDCPPACVDIDSDGYGAPPASGTAPPNCCDKDGDDCDDGDANVNPGADEICNNSPIDDDCDGLIDCFDPDCGDSPFCLACDNDGICDIGDGENEANCPSDCPCTDNDGDGYIAENTPISACTLSYSGNNDCDDNNQYMFPGNPGETCDGYDNNCSGTADEGCDDDEDGWCDSGYAYYDNFSVFPFLSNDPCPNTTNDPAHRSDCEDRTNGADGIPGNADDGANIHPGLAETGPLCADGVDNDCDGDTDCDDSDCAAFCAGCTFDIPSLPCNLN